ncbi:hypothetical protein ACFQ1S_30910, partial [Kibdelosporangium lantanae]
EPAVERLVRGGGRHRPPGHPRGPREGHRHQLHSGRIGRAMTGGALLPKGPYVEGRQTFAEHLAAMA